MLQWQCSAPQVRDERQPLVRGSRTHNYTRGLDLPSKLGVLAEKTIARMYHVDVMLDSNLDNLIGSQVGSDWCVLATLADDIGLISLLPVHTQSVLITVYGDCLKGELVRGSEDTNWDFSSGRSC